MILVKLHALLVEIMYILFSLVKEEKRIYLNTWRLKKEKNN